MPAGASPSPTSRYTRHAREVALEARAEAAPEVLDRVGRQAELARRQQLDPLEPAGRALRLGVETADAVDLAVERDRCATAPRCPSGRYRTASRESRTRPVYRPAARWHSRRPSAAGETARDRAPRRRARLSACASTKLRGARRCSAVGRSDDHDAARERRQARERAQPLRDDVRVRREAVVRQRLVVGEREQRQVARQKNASSSSSRSSCAASSRKHHQRTAGSGGRLGEREGQRGA